MKLALCQMQMSVDEGENLSRSLATLTEAAAAGADLILIPTANTQAEPLDLFDWEVRVQTFQSSVSIAMCNRTGLEDGMDFSGGSLVCDANGDVLLKAGRQEGLFYADIDMSAPSRIRQARPYTSLRRTELYR